MTTRGAALLLLLSGCSLVIDSGPEELPLRSEGPSSSALPRLNQGPVHYYDLRRSPRDGASYLALFEGEHTLRLWRLREPMKERVFQAAQIYPGSDLLVLVDPDPDPRRPKRVRLGSIDDRQESMDLILLPQGGQAVFNVYTDSPGDERVVHFLLRPGQPAFQVIHREGGVFVSYDVPWPPAANPAEGPQQPYFQAGNTEVLLQFDGDRHLWVHRYREGRSADLGAMGFLGVDRDLVLVHDADGQLLAYRVATGERTALGVKEPAGTGAIGVDGERRQLALCGVLGVWAVSYAERPARLRVLDPDPCHGQAYLQDGYAYYSAADPPQGRRVRLDGGAPAEPFPATVDAVGDDASVLDRCGGLIARAENELHYQALFGGATVSDGWIGDFQFMERGREVRFRRGCRWIRFLEDAARFDWEGELRSVRLADRKVLRLGRNVDWYTEMPDGRVLLLDNALLWGAENRLVLMDEDAGAGYTVLRNAAFVPADRDPVKAPAVEYRVHQVSDVPEGVVLARLRRGDQRFDMYRVPLPSR